jgi:hypothetical protein
MGHKSDDLALFISKRDGVGAGSRVGQHVRVRRCAMVVQWGDDAGHAWADEMAWRVGEAPSFAMIGVGRELGDEKGRRAMVLGERRRWWTGMLAG